MPLKIRRAVSGKDPAENAKFLVSSKGAVVLRNADGSMPGPRQQTEAEVVNNLLKADERRKARAAKRAKLAKG